LTITEGASATAVVDALKAQHPEAFGLIAATGAAGQEAAVTAARLEGEAAGRTAETARVKAVFANSLPGHETLIQALALDGQTSGDQAASQIVAAERQGGAAYLEGAANSEANAVKGAPDASAGKKTIDPKTLAAEARALVNAEAAKGNKITVSAAARMIAKGASA
jgi:hypothetical protein